MHAADEHGQITVDQGLSPLPRVTEGEVALLSACFRRTSLMCR